MAGTDAYRYNVGLVFGALAKRHVRRPALRFASGDIVTYGDLDLLANKVAASLVSRGVGIGKVVAICNEKTVLTFATMIACLKLGAIYVNVDSALPQMRLENMFSTARPSLLVVDAASASYHGKLAVLGVGICNLSDATVAKELAADPGIEPGGVRDVVGTDIAYVMYTSGSTGIPKGAAITHGALLNFAAWTATTFEISERDILSNINPMYFDNSVFDFYAALLNGASLVAIERNAAANPIAMLDVLERAGTTVWFSVPSMLVYLMTLELLSAERLPTLRAFVFGGEGYPKVELQKLHDTFAPKKSLFNVYGPTECTCICSARLVSPQDLADEFPLVTLGTVAENFRALVLDDAQRPVRANEIGELYLGGPQVGVGYLNDPIRTSASFVCNPLNAGSNETLYRTGDLVRLRADGRTIDFVGRKDNQIKHMGYRIELEEIEGALHRAQGVVEAAVAAIPALDGPAAIVAFVSCERDLSVAATLDILREHLPNYMIPERIVQYRTLPKNANGKIDRQRLIDSQRGVAGDANTPF